MTLDPEEELVEVLASANGRPTAAVTRHERGDLVLNVERAIVVDIGIEPGGRPSTGWTLFSVMFGATAPKPKAAATPARLSAWLAEDAARGARLYRTADGFRYLVTRPLADAAGVEADRALEALGADVDYRRRCRERGGFHARLTPAPERCGVAAAPTGFPRRDAEAAARFARWLDVYEAKRASFAACRFVGTRGSTDVDREIAPLVALHDERTGALSDRPLA